MYDWLVIMQHFFGGILKRLKTSDENVGQQEKALSSRVIFVKPPQNSVGHEFAERCPSQIDSLVMGSFVRLLAQKTYLVHK